MKLIIELSENDYKALKEDGVQNHIALADTIIAHSMPYDPQGDLISREALKIYARKVLWEQNPTNFTLIKLFDNIIDNAPTVRNEYMRGYEAAEREYKRPQGEWKLHGMIYYCSECGHECGESGDNYCGNCGADMRKGGAE